MTDTTDKQESLEDMITNLDADQASFLRGLMVGKSQTDAYLDAYECERKSANANASRLIANDSFHKVYVRAMLDSFEGLIDGFKRMSPVILRRVGEILESENEAVAARVIDSILDRIGIVKSTKLDVEGGINLVYIDKDLKDI